MGRWRELLEAQHLERQQGIDASQSNDAGNGPHASTGAGGSDTAASSPAKKRAKTTVCYSSEPASVEADSALLGQFHAFLALLLKALEEGEGATDATIGSIAVELRISEVEAAELASYLVQNLDRLGSMHEGIDARLVGKLKRSVVCDSHYGTEIIRSCV